MKGNSEKLILVTGGAGYIGSELIGQLLKAGFKVRTVDSFIHGGMSLLPWLSHERFELIVGDIRDTGVIQQSLRDVTGIVHLAAIVGDPACKANPKLAREVNSVASEQVCHLAIENGISRFVFASTCSNYGKMSDPKGFVDENSPLNPVSLYAETKVGFEKFLMASNKPGFIPVILRFATAYGLSPRPRFDLTVNEFTRDLAVGRKLEIFGEHFWRPYCHVVDLARACQMALECDSDKVGFSAFNVGDTEENYTKKMLSEKILGELGSDSDLVSFVSRNEDPRDYRVKFEKIREIMGFHITRHVQDGIREIIHAIRSGMIRDPFDQWYQNHYEIKEPGDH
jgi:nucleoside-diphosphate-sugar epimerase